MLYINIYMHIQSRYRALRFLATPNWQSPCPRIGSELTREEKTHFCGRLLELKQKLRCEKKREKLQVLLRVAGEILAD